MTDTIDAHGDPLAFKVTQGAALSPVLAAGGIDVFKVEARQMAHHQKEAVVTEGEAGSAWRLTSDEGAHLRGTDLAPFPLGFFNAGLQGDLHHRIRGIAAERGIAIERIELDLLNRYWLTGSFVHGTGEGHAEPSEIEVRIDSPAGPEAIRALVDAALGRSPAIALLRQALARNTFALYINGRRRAVEGVADSPAADVADPYRVHARAPRPLAQAAVADGLIEKTGQHEEGVSALASASPTTRVIRRIHGRGVERPDGRLEVDTWLEMPGASHFRFRTGVGVGADAPSGLALLSAGIAFCYMTQLSRYIENMKMPIGGVRLVQFNPFAVSGDGGSAGAIDTHLFLNGEAPDRTHLELLTIAARTCYLHATAAAALEPVVRVVHNGVAAERTALSPAASA